MHEHRINYQQNFIAGWYNPDFKILDDLIEYYQNADHKSAGKTYFEGEPVVDVRAKDSTDCAIKDPILKDRYIQYLQSVIDLYIIKYPFCNEYEPWTIVENIQVQHYQPNGGFFSWHTERGTMNVLDRHLVFMTYLNTVTDQGETEFYHQNIKIQPEKGLTIIWPADWTFTHRGISSTSQEKYVVTGWFNYVSPT
jgi:hypothetical protein